MNSLLANVKHLPTTISGVLVLLSMLPEDPTVQHIMNISPNAAKYIMGIGTIAGGLLLILGQRQNQSAAEKAVQDSK